MKPENCSALNKMCLCDICIWHDSAYCRDDKCNKCKNNWSRSNFDEDETILNRICKKHHLNYDETLTYLYWKDFNSYCKKIDKIDEKTYNKDEYEAESKRNLELICDVTKAVGWFQANHLVCGSDIWEGLDAHLDHLAELKQRVENCTIKTFLKIIGVECNYKITQKVTCEEILQNRDDLLKSIEDDIQLTELDQQHAVYEEEIINATKEACNSKFAPVKPSQEIGELILKLFLGFLGVCGLFIFIMFIIACIQSC